jgi:23S rRNA (uracil1939-C5)-methyltransferase
LIELRLLRCRIESKRFFFKKKKQKIFAPAGCGVRVPTPAVNESFFLMTHCLHFGACGGCAVDDRHAIDKFAMLSAALEKAGFPAVAAARLIETPLRTRRRVDLAAARLGAEIVLGLHAARSHDIVDMQECVLLRPNLFALVAKLRALLRHLEGFRRTASVIVNWLDDGPDVLLRLDAAVSGPDRAKMIAFAKASGAVRISAAKGDGEPELVAMLRPPLLTLSGVAVAPAPGAFLQASREGEAAIVSAVLAGLPKLAPKARIVELYAGVGTMSFALAERARVEAYEGAAPAVAALDAAVRRAGLAGRIRAEIRDLSRRPLKVSEMAGAACVVLDPPFAGAGPQIRNLAASGVARVVYVSCNPAALANDAAALRQAGYRVAEAAPIDQFPYSENVESVVVFEK